MSEEYALLLYNSLESFGEVVILLNFADDISSAYRSVFLSLDRPHPRCAVIEAAGHEALFLFTADGKADETVIARLFASPPAFCVACDYSQFNVWREVLPGVQAGERIMRRLQETFGVRAALCDLAGLSLQCKTPLRATYSAVFIPESGYAMSRGGAPVDAKIRRLRASRRAPASPIAEQGRRRRRHAVFVSYPRPQGWTGAGLNDPYAVLWGRAVERSLKQLSQPTDVVTFRDMASLFADASELILLADTAEVRDVDAWLRTVDVVLTPNWCSTLAARGARFGGRTVVTYNDAAGAGLMPEWLGLIAELRLDVDGDEAFGRWLPPDFGSSWPGVDVGLTQMILNARAAPLFDTAMLARTIAEALDDVRAPLANCQDAVAPLQAVADLSKVETGL